MKKIIIFGLFCMSLLIFGCGDSGKSGQTTDNGNDSGRETGSLYGECYPNETCDKGLECDIENNICIRESSGNNSEKNDSENEDTDTMPEETIENDDESNFSDSPDNSVNDNDNIDSDLCIKESGKTWSELLTSPHGWESANSYCEHLTVCGYSDWHLPTIGELRSLIQNCPATQTGGECGITDSCLSTSECGYDACSGCHYDSDNPNKYNKLGDTEEWILLWSSSNVNYGYGYYYYVSLTSASVGITRMDDSGVSVRCVRNAD